MRETCVERAESYNINKIVGYDHHRGSNNFESSCYWDKSEVIVILILNLCWPVQFTIIYACSLSTTTSDNCVHPSWASIADINLYLLNTIQWYLLPSERWVGFFITSKYAQSVVVHTNSAVVKLESAFCQIPITQEEALKCCCCNVWSWL